MKKGAKFKNDLQTTKNTHTEPDPKHLPSPQYSDTVGSKGEATAGQVATMTGSFQGHNRSHLKHYSLAFCLAENQMGKLAF